MNQDEYKVVCEAMTKIRQAAELLVEIDAVPEEEVTVCGNCKHDDKAGSEAPCCDCIDYDNRPKWEEMDSPEDSPEDSCEPCLDCVHEPREWDEEPCKACCNDDDPIHWEKKEVNEIEDPAVKVADEYKWECVGGDDCNLPCRCLLQSKEELPTGCLFSIEFDRDINWRRV